VPLITQGFADSFERAKHFDKHVTRRQEFAFATASEYEEAADRFLGEPLDPSTTEQCFRTKRDGSTGDMIRYNRVTQELGILRRDGVIWTYFIPDPARHKRATNLDYFNDLCNEIKD
jgi:hypothetical protein